MTKTKRRAASASTNHTSYLSLVCSECYRPMAIGNGVYYCAYCDQAKVVIAFTVKGEEGAELLTRGVLIDIGPKFAISLITAELGGD